MQSTLYCINTNCKQEIPLGTVNCPHCRQDQRPPGQRTWNCAKCGIENPETRSWCSSCSWVRGVDYVPPPPNSTSTTPTSATPSDQPQIIKHRYSTLRWLSGLFDVMAWVILLFSIIGPMIVIGLQNNSSGYPNDVGYKITLLLTSLIYGGLGFLVLKTISELILLFIDIEENTRQTAINTKPRT